MSVGRSPRWLMSFADLTLLLLAFFVLLHARAQGGAAAASMRAAFGGRPDAAAVELAAAELFQPGEAVLRGGAAAQLRALGTRLRGRRVRIAATGSDERGLRLDRWELAAARLAAVARALGTGGLDPAAIDLVLPDPRARPGPQRIAVGPA